MSSDAAASASPSAFAAPRSGDAVRQTRADLPPAALALKLAAAQAVGSAPPAETSSEPAWEPTPEPEPDTIRPLKRRARQASDRANTLRVRTTAYARDEADHFGFGSMSAIGTPLRLGKLRSAAADWSRYPAGTRFQIQGDPAIYEIDDYGSALVGSDTIDLYQRDEFDMEDWGVRHVDIEILRWGSPSRSLAILKGRSGHPHVDAMIRDLNSGQHLKAKD